METSSSSLESIQEAAGLRSTGVVGNPYLIGLYLLGSSLLGLLVIIGAFWHNRSNLSLFKKSCVMSFTCQENRLVGVQLIHRSLVTLLFMDALNLIVALILGAEFVHFFCADGINCLSVQITWFLSRWYGVIIHLLNASLSIYHLCHQSLSIKRVRIFYALIGVLMGIMTPLYLHATKVAIFILAGIMFLFALLVIETSRAPTSSPSTATLKKLIVAIAMCNFLVVYVPTFIVQCLLSTAVFVDNFVNYEIAYVNVLYFTNFHLIFDGFLCALVLKLPSGEEQQQQQQEQQQQQQELGFPNPGYNVSTTVNQY